MSADFLSNVSYATSGALIAAEVVLPILPIIVGFLRLYRMSLQKAAAWVYDWMTLPALVSKSLFQQCEAGFIGTPVGVSNPFTSSGKLRDYSDVNICSEYPSSKRMHKALYASAAPD